MPFAIVAQLSLGMDVDLGPGHIVLDGDPVPSSRKRGTAAPRSIRLMSIMATIAHLSYYCALVLHICTDATVKGRHFSVASFYEHLHSVSRLCN